MTAAADTRQNIESLTSWGRPSAEWSSRVRCARTQVAQGEHVLVCQRIVDDDDFFPALDELRPVQGLQIRGDVRSTQPCPFDISSVTVFSPPRKALRISKRDLEDLGGWKSPKTLMDVYLLPDEDAQRGALEGG